MIGADGSAPGLRRGLVRALVYGVIWQGPEHVPTLVLGIERVAALGGYQLLAGAEAAVAPGYDSRLRRRVWNHRPDAGAASLADARRDANRPVRALAAYIATRVRTLEAEGAAFVTTTASDDGRSWTSPLWSVHACP